MNFTNDAQKILTECMNADKKITITGVNFVCQPFVSTGFIMDLRSKDGEVLYLGNNYLSLHQCQHEKNGRGPIRLFAPYTTHEKDGKGLTNTLYIYSIKVNGKTVFKNEDFYTIFTQACQNSYKVHNGCIYNHESFNQYAKQLAQLVGTPVGIMGKKRGILKTVGMKDGQAYVTITTGVNDYCYSVQPGDVHIDECALSDIKTNTLYKYTETMCQK